MFQVTLDGRAGDVEPVRPGLFPHARVNGEPVGSFGVAHRAGHMDSDGQRIEVLPGRQQVRWKVRPDMWGRVIRWMLGVASFWATKKPHRSGA